MSTVFTTTLARLLDPGLRKIYSDEAAMLQDEYTQFVNVSSMDEPYYTDYKMAFLGLIPQKPEGEAVTYDGPIPGGTKVYTPLNYGLGFRSTHESVRDERYGQLKKMSKHLSRSVKQTMNIIGATAHNLAFSGGTTGFDGAQLCAAHPLLGGGTYSNLGTAADLSVAGLQAAMISGEKTISDRGFGTPIKFTKLIIPTDSRYIAVEILKTTELPYTNQNTVNAIREDNLQHKVWHFLTDSDAWFLTSPDHDINMFWREKPVFSSGDDFDTGDAKHKVYFSVTTPSYGDWRGIFGNAGA